MCATLTGPTASEVIDLLLSISVRIEATPTAIDMVLSHRTVLGGKTALFGAPAES